MLCRVGREPERAFISSIGFENNVIYDTINIYAMRIYHLGTNVVVRNNTFYPGHSEPKGNCSDQTFENRLFRPKSGFVVHDIAAGPGIKSYNNYVWSWNAGGSWLSTSPSGTSTIVHSTTARTSVERVTNRKGDLTLAPAELFGWRRNVQRTDRSCGGLVEHRVS